jgi:delta 1-pyrroline-5-carboxylate dehydrogenase
MERLEDYNAYVVGIVGALTLSVFYLLLRSDPEAAVPYNVTPPQQSMPGWKGEVLEEPSLKVCHCTFISLDTIDFLQVSGSSLVQCYAPATGEALGRINPSSTSSIDRAITKATEAQTQWAQTTFSQRRKLLNTMLKFVLENQEAIARVACLDSGKTKVDAILGEILVTAEKLRWVIKHGEQSLKSEKRPGSRLMAYKWHEVMWQPLGVVAACVSWK